MISSELKQELLSLNSISELNEAFDFARANIISQTKASIKVGSFVYVVQRTKKTKGIVEKINKTKALVKMRNSVYRVPLTMLEAA